MYITANRSQNRDFLANSLTLPAVWANSVNRKNINEKSCCSVIYIDQWFKWIQ